MIYSKTKELKLFEIIENKTLRNFLVSLADRESQYSNEQMMILKSLDNDLLETIVSFRDYIRMRKIENMKRIIQRYNESQSSAFSIFESTFNDQSTQENDHDNDQNQIDKKKSCLCDHIHR